MNTKETPVLLLTGYLGSGKTTLLNRILANEKGIKFAVIVNDIGEVNIDADLIQQGGVVGEGDTAPDTAKGGHRAMQLRRCGHRQDHKHPSVRLREGGHLCTLDRCCGTRR